MVNSCFFVVCIYKLPQQIQNGDDGGLLLEVFPSALFFINIFPMPCDFNTSLEFLTRDASLSFVLFTQIPAAKYAQLNPKKQKESKGKENKPAKEQKKKETPKKEKKKEKEDEDDDVPKEPKKNPLADLPQT
jgi:hypothetical protein